MTVSIEQRVPNRIERLALPERLPSIGMSLRAAERELERNAGRHTGLLDLTYADTKRFPAPPWAIKSYVEAATSGGRSYTAYRGEEHVRSTVGASVGGLMGIPVDPKRELILTPGTQAALYTALAAVLEEGDKAIIADPDYLTNERLIRYFGAECIKLPLRWEVDGRHTFDPDEMEAAFRQKPKVFLFSNPNNPTGTVHSEATLQQIAELAMRYDVLVIADELYSRLVYEGRNYFHLAAMEGIKARTISLLGPSKTESMSGYRLGVAVAPGDIVDRMEDVQSVSALRAPAYAQHTLLHWIRDDQEFVARRVKEYQLLRDMAVDAFKDTNFIRASASHATSYIFPKLIGIGASDQEIALRLQDVAGVIVNPGYQSGERGRGHFRICFAQDEKIFANALDRIVSTLRSFQS
ncbi:aminotransferase class I/II-fold pyridoxal phosphate-dependent enzyme [Pelagibius sp.]|uniref:aminotransferase class I/II-fold pyridoxal phosphate-dependent enzyme n=1 Tax=Pelagibius sp. TaxID=1931238 RepID=UPI003BAF7999